MSRLSITIYLIKESYSDNDACIRQSERATLDQITIDVPKSTSATLYLRRNRAKRPDWRNLFPTHVDWSRYRTNTFSGVFLIKVDGRLFALTAGSGRYLLDPFAIEENFGFKIVINSADPATIRKIEKKTINQNPISSIEQVTRTSGLGDFHVDYYTDIISKIRARSANEKLGTIIDGRDSLQIGVECTLDDIPEILQTCITSYKSTTYKRHFPNIDNISEIKDREICSALDNILLEKLNAGEHERIWAAMPEIIQDEDFDVFQYSSRPNALRYHDIELADCLNKYTSKGRTFSKKDLERDAVYVRKHNDEVYPRWHVWMCIYAELTREDQEYILVEGKWFRVRPEFIAQIDERIQNIPRSTYAFPAWKQQVHEKDYLRALGRANNDNYMILDRDVIRLEGQSPIEFCDVYIPGDTFVHVKRYGSSEVLSYLFNQGRVSAQLFLEDKRFRAQAREKCGDKATFVVDERPDPRNYTVAYIIGSKHADAQVLPLFARVVLMNTFTDLVNYGFSVTIGFVKVELM